MRNIFKWEMTGKELQWWESLRKRGGVFFVFVWGVLAFSGAMFLFDVGWGVFVKHKYYLLSVDADQAVGDFVTAFLLALSIWYSNEGRYSKARERVL